MDFQVDVELCCMKFLVIQTAFIGDVVLATPIIEKLHRFYPEAQIDFLLRKGNETLLTAHPLITKVWVWDKKRSKYRNWWNLLLQLRKERYNWAINCQRFTAAGLLTILSGSQQTVGFRKNPASLFFSRRLPHVFGTLEQPVHEVDRNLLLIEHLTDASFEQPRLYPSDSDFQSIQNLAPNKAPYCCIAPTSVWFTKQYPASKWIKLIDRLPENHTVFLLGGPGDAVACEEMAVAASHPNVQNLAGQLSFLESSALMRGAAMNYVNDSAPLHFASAVDAPVTAVFCSTLPLFGFTPLSSIRHIVESGEQIACRPCGLHGHNSCPEGHFACAWSIQEEQFSIPG